MADKIKLTEDQIKDLVLPDGFQLQVVPKKSVKIAELQFMVDDLKTGMGDDPTEQELAQWCRDTRQHPFFVLQDQILQLENHIANLQKELDNGL